MTGVSAGRGAEYRPADLGPPRCCVRGVPRSYQVSLPDRAGDREGVLGHVTAQSTVGDIEVVVRAVMHSDGELGGRDHERLDRPGARRVGHSPGAPPPKCVASRGFRHRRVRDVDQDAEELGQRRARSGEDAGASVFERL